MMTNSVKAAPASIQLMRAAEAITNWRALGMAMIAGIVCFISLALTGWMAKNSLLLGAIFALISFVVFLIAYSSVGLMLMRQAQGITVGFGDAILQATFSVHRLIGVAILLFLVVLGVTIFAALVLFVCKIPGLGALLYAIAFPVLTLLLGMTLAGTFYVGFPLAAPAVWEGNTTVETVARLLVIVRKRLLTVITNLVLLTILVMFLTFVVSSVLMSGYSLTMAISNVAGINPMMNLAGMFGGLMGFAGGYGGMGSNESMASATSYVGAFGFATGLLFTIGSIVPMLTFMNGTCLVYLQAAEGLNFGEAEQQLRDQVEEAKRKTQDYKERANTKLQQAKTTINTSNEQSQASTRSCNSCHTNLGLDDVFCGNCGTKN